MGRRRKRQNSGAAATPPPQPTVASPISARAASAEIDDIFSKRVKKDGDSQPPPSESTVSNKTGKRHRKSIGSSRATAPSRGSADDPFGRGEGWADDGLGGIYNAEGWTGR